MSTVIYLTVDVVNLQMTNVTLEQCGQLIQLYEPSAEARANRQLLLDGITPCLFNQSPSYLFVLAFSCTTNTHNTPTRNRVDISILLAALSTECYLPILSQTTPQRSNQIWWRPMNDRLMPYALIDVFISFVSRTHRLKRSRWPIKDFSKNRTVDNGRYRL